MAGRCREPDAECALVEVDRAATREAPPHPHLTGGACGSVHLPVCALEAADHDRRPGERQEQHGTAGVAPERLVMGERQRRLQQAGIDGPYAIAHALVATVVRTAARCSRIPGDRCAEVGSSTT